MEYLVTMTTHVPDGTAAADVDDVKAREAAHSRELAAQGHLLRLWRPPLAPGEWRSIGLFAAADGAELEKVLASMPLRIWRTDQVTPLSPHPNDPSAPRRAADAAVEYLLSFTITVPDGTPSQTVDDAEAGEARRAHELAEQGRLIRLWTVPAEPGGPQAIGVWAARDATEMSAIVASLPLTKAGLMTTQVTPLTPHPSDPGTIGHPNPEAKDAP